MSLFTLADLHLSLGSNKPMDIFEGWANYIEKIKYNWYENISENDTVVLIGDISWGKSLDESLPDFKFINNLPGKKIILKGNHDYWWSSKTKIEKFFSYYKLSSLQVLHNNSFVVDNISICGTRGWMFETGEQHCSKLINREAIRLETSIKSASHFNMPIISFLHYPPIYCNQCVNPILSILKQYNISQCFYGHLHGKAINNALNGLHENITYHLVSCDYTNFKPIKITK